MPENSHKKKRQRTTDNEPITFTVILDLDSFHRDLNRGNSNAEMKAH